VTRYFDVDAGQRDLVFVDWTDMVIERSQSAGVITKASLFDRAANNFSVVINYSPNDSPLVVSQTVTFSTGGQAQGQQRLLT